MSNTTKEKWAFNQHMSTLETWTKWSSSSVDNLLDADKKIRATVAGAAPSYGLKEGQVEAHSRMSESLKRIREELKNIEQQMRRVKGRRVKAHADVQGR